MMKWKLKSTNWTNHRRLASRTGGVWKNESLSESFGSRWSNKVKINAYYKTMKEFFDLACMSTCCWGLPKPKYEPFITHNRGTLTKNLNLLNSSVHYSASLSYHFSLSNNKIIPSLLFVISRRVISHQRPWSPSPGFILYVIIYKSFHLRLQYSNLIQVAYSNFFVRFFFNDLDPVLSAADIHRPHRRTLLCHHWAIITHTVMENWVVGGSFVAK